MQQLMRLLREPLLGRGGLLVGFYAALSGPAPTPVNRIVVGLGVASWRPATEYRRRPPVTTVRTMVDNFVREEVYREALALGLRARRLCGYPASLQQRWSFLLRTTGLILWRLVRAKLDAFYDERAGVFRRPASLWCRFFFPGRMQRLKHHDGLLAALQFQR
jgi:hypothetical protein